MIIFDSPYLKIQYDEQLQAILEEWKLDFTVIVAGDNFRKPLTTLIQEFKNRKLSKWLCDITEQKTLLSEDQLWLESYYYSELLKNGLHTAALVNAKNILGTVNAKNCLENLHGDKIQIEVFNKNHLAKSWLASLTV